MNPSKCCPIVETTLLVKLYYKDSENTIVALRAYRYMKGMRDSKGPITSSALNRMMKEFGATGSLALRQRSGRRLSTAAAVATTVAIPVGGCCTWGVQSSRCFEADRNIIRKCLKSTAYNFATFYPYKLQHNQELKPPDFDSRRDFANLVLNKMEEQHD
ncbi:transposable element tc3 transposase [Trichonephila clavata]|uniref:Transposable element tc3 transposase n=1 Tax=Trichonephila clavata TaxID=2740835 RepID=A0A8X6GVW2_TRICU|nr:transposable element tc3 transposase [Trichonephila clavata]